MTSYAWFVTFTYFSSLTICRNVHANHLDLEFKPENSEQIFSDNMASGKIYGFSNISEVSKENAAILCTTHRKQSKYIKLEFILFDEPPKSLSVEIENEYLSKLLNSTLFCLVSQMLDINKWADEKGSEYYTGRTGKVSYQSEGRQNITIELSGLKLRKETATHLYSSRYQASRSYRKYECMKGVGKGDASKYPKLGKLCTETLPHKRWMLNSNKEHVCRECCSKNHWSIDMNTCAPCSTQNEANVWTKCEYDYNAHMIKPTIPILPTLKESKTSTITSTTTGTKINSKTNSTELPKEITAEGKNNDSEPTTDSAVITTELPKETTAEGKSDSITGSIIGLKLRKETATHPQGLRIQASRSYRKDECLKDVWDGEGDDAFKFPELGKFCNDFATRPSKRWMLNRNNELVCGECCSNHYWCIVMKTCRPCFTQNEPNVWTTCNYKAPSPPNVLSTINMKPHTSTIIPTSTTSTTIPTSTVPPVRPPLQVSPQAQGNCVKIGNIPQGQDRDNLGYPCNCSSGTGRKMFNEKQELVCSVCCANHYFSTRSYKCEECGSCSTNPNSNIHTHCMYDPNCKRK